MSSNLPPEGPGHGAQPPYGQQPQFPQQQPYGHQPGGYPQGQPGAEHLHQGGGSPVPPQKRSGSKKALIIGSLALVGVVAAGGATWAALKLSGGGAQPSEALPDTTIGYVSIDLDPPAGQKVEALRTLNKFPAFEDEVGIGEDDDVRKAVFEKIQEESEACQDLDFDQDIAPWLGERAAFAGVSLADGEKPVPVAVVAITDEAKAEDGVTKLAECGKDEADTMTDEMTSSMGGSEQSGDGAYVIEGDWMYFAEDEDTVRKVIDLTDDGTLADDADFQSWTDELGDRGVVTMYAAPEAGTYLADQLAGFSGMAESMSGELSGETSGDSESLWSEEELAGMRQDMIDSGSTPEEADAFIESLQGSETGLAADDDEATPTPDPAQALEELRKQLEDFQGAAGTIRFADGSVELALAGDASLAQAQGIEFSDRAGEGIAGLPDGTVAALSMSLGDGWFDTFAQQMETYSGQDAEELISQMEEQSGLSLPEDAETMAGESVVISLGEGFDPEAMANSSDASEVPVGVRVTGDPAKIQDVLDKLEQSGVPALVTAEDGDVIAIGQNQEYVDQLAQGGDLGDSDAFQDAVPDADDASAVAFVDFDAADGWLAELVGESEKENVEPLSAFGMSSTVDGDVARVVIRLTTD